MQLSLMAPKVRFFSDPARMAAKQKEEEEKQKKEQEAKKVPEAKKVKDNKGVMHGQVQKMKAMKRAPPPRKKMLATPRGQKKGNST